MALFGVDGSNTSSYSELVLRCARTVDADEAVTVLDEEEPAGETGDLVPLPQPAPSSLLPSAASPTTVIKLEGGFKYHTFPVSEGTF